MKVVAKKDIWSFGGKQLLALAGFTGQAIGIAVTPNGKSFTVVDFCDGQRILCKPSDLAPVKNKVKK